MAIPYKVRKKVFLKDGKKTELWYAVSKKQQTKGGLTEKDIAERVSRKTGFSKGVVEGLITEITDAIEFSLSYGFSVTFKNLGSFQTAVTSEGFEDPREVTPGKVKLSRVYFIADRKMTKRIGEQGYFQIPFSSYMPQEFWGKERDEEEDE